MIDYVVIAMKYDPRLIAIIKRCSGAMWHPGRKAWFVPEFNYGGIKHHFE